MKSSFSGQRILVTGANGFIGSHLCLRLFQEGAEVHGAYRSKRPEDVTGPQWWQADLAELTEVRKIGRQARPDMIFHLASHVKGAPDIEHVVPTFQSNLQSTINVLMLAAELGCRRVVLTGSLAEPEAKNGEEFPSAPYAAAKWASTGYARMFHALYKIPVVIARVFMVYGPGQKDLTKLVPYVVLSLLQGKTPNISSGQRLVDWIYVSDVVDGFLALAQTPNLDGATLDIGSGSLVSIRDIVQNLVRVTGGGANAHFGALPDRPLEPTRVAKVDDTFAKTGWRPRVPLQEGLENTVRWYRVAFEHSPENYQLISA
jgi:nucleoside-diphosphate-sugar epimerase